MLLKLFNKTLTNLYFLLIIKVLILPSNLNYMQKDLQTLKILLDWAKSELDKDKGAQVTFPERYEKSLKNYEKIKNRFNATCLYSIEEEL